MPVSPKKKKRQWVPERKPFQRTTDNTKYNTRRWKAFSKRYKAEHPLCVMCEAEGITSAAAVTDHIVRVEDGGAMWDENNLQSLCVYHHNQKSGKEAHGYRQKNGDRGNILNN